MPRLLTQRENEKGDFSKKKSRRFNLTLCVYTLESFNYYTIRVSCNIAFQRKEQKEQEVH